MENLRGWIELTANLIEALAVALMVGFILIGTVKWLFFSISHRGVAEEYARYRVILGKALLVGLELLVAADIIRTVILDTTLLNIVTLAALVLVRTFLGWTLTVEIEGHWPWQNVKEAGPSATEADDAKPHQA